MILCAMITHAWCAAAASGQVVTTTEPIIDGSGAEVVAPQRLSRPANRAVAGSLQGCTGPTDCNDSLPCTADLCVSGTCLYLPIPSCVSCEIDYSCPPADVVFIMDTSGSMRDEASALCGTINGVINELASVGIDASAIPLGITQMPGGAYACLSDTVVSLFGGVVPGVPQTCLFPNGTSPYESWGPATAIVAQRFPWRPGATRIIVPISDEGPCNGSRPEGCNDPGDDRDSINNAIAIAQANNVIVSPIAGTGSDACVINLGSTIAAATGGALYQTKNPMVDFRDSLISIILQHCTADDRCEDDDPCTSNDRCLDGMCKGTLTPGCRQCFDNIDCNDLNKCTNDVCVSGFCEWTPKYDSATACCDPTTGTLRAIDDGNVCTGDTCDPSTGSVTHVNLASGMSCDDGQTCTVGDACNGAGACRGVGIQTISCQSNDDCFGHLCQLPKGVCACNGTPELCLAVEPSDLPNTDCHSVGSEIMVNIELGNSAALISGGQFLVGYDPTSLEFIDIVPGNAVDLESPFGTELSKIVDATNGSVFYAVGVVIGGPMSHGPTVMASLRFRAKTACSIESLCFMDSNPLNTRLTNSSGHIVPFTTCCTEEFRIAGASPTLSCPSSLTVNAEAGVLSAGVAWNPVSPSSSCGEPASLQCVAANSQNVDVDDLVPIGGRAPLGQSTFSCTATNSCGITSTCDWNVTVNALHTVEVDVQLSPTVSAGPLRRCIEFEFYSSCQESSVKVQKTIEFGLPLNLPGRAERIQMTLPPGQYSCATARDIKHSLRSVALVTISGGKFVARFKGDPAMGGNWLIGGNLDGNSVIDAVDQALLMSQYLQTVAIQTPCTATGFHADINGDGMVNVDDLSFIQRNLLKTDAPLCCQSNTAAIPMGFESISVDELNSLGYGDLSAADVNRDGVVDRADADLLIRRESAKLQSKKQIGGN